MCSWSVHPLSSYQQPKGFDFLQPHQCPAAFLPGRDCVRGARWESCWTAALPVEGWAVSVGKERVPATRSQRAVLCSWQKAAAFQLEKPKETSNAKCIKRSNYRVSCEATETFSEWLETREKSGAQCWWLDSPGQKSPFSNLSQQFPTWGLR